jgi:hypothetical protein
LNKQFGDGLHHGLAQSACRFFFKAALAPVNKSCVPLWAFVLRGSPRKGGFTRAARRCDPARQWLLHVSSKNRLKYATRMECLCAGSRWSCNAQSHAETCRRRVRKNGWVRLKDRLGRRYVSAAHCPLIDDPSRCCLRLIDAVGGAVSGVAYCEVL